MIQGHVFLSLLLLVWMSGGNVVCGYCASRTRNVVVLVPALTLAEHDTVLSNWLRLEPHAAYLIREDGNVKRIAGFVNGALCSPSGAWVSIENGRSDQGPSGGSHKDIVVLDTLARQLVRVDDVTYSAWSPNGDRLAMVNGWCPGECELPITNKVTVWDGRRGTQTVYAERPYAAEWLGSDSLLLDSYRGIRILDLRTGQSTASSFHGRDVSSDRRFSLSDNSESAGPRVWDEIRGIDITAEIRQLMGGAQIRPLPGPFWVQHPSRGALLCIPTCLYPSELSPSQRDSRSCWTYVIDIPSRTVVKRIPGRALAPSAGRDSAVFLRNGNIKFEDLLK